MPEFYLFGGPNGAGKTTIALRALPDLGCHEFVNADAIARALSPYHPESMALQSGKLMKQRLQELSLRNVNFATESTLAARSFVPFIKDCQLRGYTFNLIYIWLPSAEMNVARVAARVRAGGHDILPDVIRRRYEAGRKNFVELYMPLADRWRVLNNSGLCEKLIAEGGLKQSTSILDEQSWRQIHAR